MFTCKLGNVIKLVSPVESLRQLVIFIVIVSPLMKILVHKYYRGLFLSLKNMVVVLASARRGSSPGRARGLARQFGLGNSPSARLARCYLSYSRFNDN